MKVGAVYPGKPHTMHLEDVPVPNIANIPGGRGVLVKVLRHLTEDRVAIKVYIEVAI